MVLKKGYLCIALSTVLFSTMEIVLKSIAGVFNPIQLTFTRFLVGGLVLLPVALRELKKREMSVARRDLAAFEAASDPRQSDGIFLPRVGHPWSAALPRHRRGPAAGLCYSHELHGGAGRQAGQGTEPAPGI